MSELVASRFVLAVLDLEKSTRFYTEVLGFEVDAQPEGWSFLHRDACYLMLGGCPGEVPASQCGA